MKLILTAKTIPKVYKILSQSPYSTSAKQRGKKRFVAHYITAGIDRAVKREISQKTQETKYTHLVRTRFTDT